MKNLFLVSTLVLAACGSSVCDRANTVTKANGDKIAACSTTTATASVTVNVEQCKKNESSCTSDDIKKANAFLDCVEAVKAPECAGKTDAEKGMALSAYGASAGACAAQIAGVTAACTNAISGTSAATGN